MIDVHIICTPGNEALCEQQVSRLQHPLVNIVRGSYVQGNILEARYRAFAQGSAPFVSWVDDDDEVLDLSWLPEAVQKLQDQAVSAVYPRWKATEQGRERHT